jgi:hypothetical protein
MDRLNTLIGEYIEIEAERDSLRKVAMGHTGGYG